ncbi:MAG: shikimate dehydrogenase [Halocynthiibacter sp.]|jgi:shikimate dehydrogenase
MIGLLQEQGGAGPTGEDKKLIGLIGSGILKSLSPQVLEAEAAHHGLRLHYQLIDLDRSGLAPQDALAVLPGLIDAVRLIGFDGLNITYPCKQAILPLLDEISQEARAMGAVNVVTIRDGKLSGHNSDGPGWAAGFQRALPKGDLRDVVLMGCGGAGAAVAHAVLGMGAQSLSVFDRDATRAAQLAQALESRFGAGRAKVCEDLEACVSRATGFIHATPVGMLKAPGMPIPAQWLRAQMWVADVVYVPLQTELLRAAAAKGCAVIDGGHMNVGQAVLGFGHFTGLAPNVERMDAHFRSIVGAF